MVELNRDHHPLPISALNTPAVRVGAPKLPLAPPAQEDHGQAQHHDRNAEPANRGHTARVGILCEGIHERQGEKLRGHVARLPEGSWMIDSEFSRFRAERMGLRAFSFSSWAHSVEPCQLRHGSTLCAHLRSESLQPERCPGPFRALGVIPQTGRAPPGCSSRPSGERIEA